MGSHVHQFRGDNVNMQQTRGNSEEIGVAVEKILMLDLGPVYICIRWQISRQNAKLYVLHVKLVFNKEYIVSHSGENFSICVSITFRWE